MVFSYVVFFSLLCVNFFLFCYAIPLTRETGFHCRLSTSTNYFPMMSDSCHLKYMHADLHLTLLCKCRQMHELKSILVVNTYSLQVNNI